MFPILAYILAGDMIPTAHGIVCSAFQNQLGVGKNAGPLRTGCPRETGICRGVWIITTQM